jgi:para-aminobenzoate synthetase component 1
VVCALAYDLGRRVERLPTLARDDAHLPVLWAARYDAAYVWDRVAGTGRLVATSRAAADALAARLTRPPPADAPLVPGEARPEMARADYAAALRRILEHIADGDVYQVNYTLRFSAPCRGLDPGAFFARLHARTPSPFAACLRLDASRSILSVSPERFLRWTPDGRVETRPIKGTRKRGATPVEDAALQAELAASEKDRAEHVMIVDLERNDLGRICLPGTVKPTRLFAPEGYATVHHLVSTVEGRLRPDVGLPELLRATFPGGSITGAPKIRAMEVIETLEPVRRGVYCGALGYLDAAGGGDLNIAIRTAWSAGDRLYYQAGGGIVADSDPDAEWDEAMVKARAFLEACAHS